MTTPAQVIESLSLTGTNLERISQQLAAIKDWLATSEGRHYMASMPEGSLPMTDAFQSGMMSNQLRSSLS